MMQHVFLFNPADWEDWQAALDNHAADLIAITIFIVIALAVVRTVFKRTLRTVLTRTAIRRHGTKRLMEIEQRADTVVNVVVWVATGFFLFVGLVLVLDEFNKNVSALIAGAGVAGIAIGFASQQIIRDFLNGAIILIEDQFVIGDVIQIKGVTGTVVDMNLRRTLLRDLDGNVHVVPNGFIDVTTNYTEGFSRINLNVSVAYDQDVDRAIEVINEECQRFAEDHAVDVITPPGVLRVDALGESSVDIKVLGDVKPGEQWTLTGDLRQRLKRRFDAEGIEIPYRHLTLTSKHLEMVTKSDSEVEEGVGARSD